MTQQRSIVEWTPFPTDILPSPIKEYVIEGSRALNTDPAYLAVPVLAACAGSIGNARRIQLKATWSEPAVIWAGVVAESGTGKTPALKMAMAPCETLDCEAHERWQSAFLAHQVDLQKYKQAAAAWKKDGAVGEPPLQPRSPQTERLLVNDITIEALAKLLHESPRGLIAWADELAGWFHSHSRYGRSGDAARWLSLHSGGSLTIDRKSGNPPTVYIPLATTSIIGGVQPGILRKLMTTECRAAGLAARFLFVRPPRSQRKWSSHEVPDAVIKGYDNLIRGLRSLDMDVDEEGINAPKMVTLTTDARRLYADFYDSHACQQGQLTPSLDAAWSKLEGYAARFALVLQCVQEFHKKWDLPKPVEAETMAAAISLTQWFADEAKRVYAEADGMPLERELSDLVEYVDSRGGSVTVRQLTRGPQRYRGNPGLAKQDLNVLVTHGFGKWDAPAPTESGGRPSEVFHLSVSDVTERGNVAGIEAPEKAAAIAGGSALSPPSQRRDAA